jgi:acyl-coenzyme A synthetase/AMP-(fatty) acid ligase
MNTLNSLVNRYLSQSDKKILITDSWNSFSTAEFTKKVNYYKNLLVQNWSKKPQLKRGIAIYLDRGVEYLAIIFASWLANGYYLPLNKNSPQSIIDEQIRDSQVSLIAIIPASSDQVELKFIKPDENTPQTDENDKIQFDDLAYVIFTSGSTGRKKGVAISKTALNSYSQGIQTIFDKVFIANSVIINGELTFDISLADIIFALCFKTEICITSQASDLLSLCSIIKKRNVESVYAVPSTWELILDIENKIDEFSLTGVKNIFVGGEAFTKKLLLKIRERCPFAKIYNMYGPTEFTINATFFEITEELFSSDNEIIPIGFPLPGVTTHIKQDSSPGNTGELYLSGKQLLAGYVNHLNPIIIENNTAYYPTGDLVQQDQNGVIHYIGRIRDYEKVSGYRLNIFDIGSAIDNILCEQCKTVIIGGKIICIVKLLPNTKKDNINSRIYSYANNYLEIYERPAKIIFLPEFPLNASGKLDYRAIEELI